MPKKLKIKIAKTAGFCFGVKRAAEMTEKALTSKKRNVFSFGPIIHNPQVMESLCKRGLKMVKNVKEIPAGSVFIIRSHGIAPEIEKKIKDKKIKIFDATCPFVKRAQKTAANFCRRKRTIVICGDPKHAEVIGINGYAGNEAVIIQNKKEARKLGKLGKIGILSQTTQQPELFKDIINILTKKNKNIEVINTICLNSSAKKEEVKKLAKKVDVMIIIGGKNSNNTKKLAETSLAVGIVTHHIETAGEMDVDWFKNAKIVGISAGASTPLYLIEEVKKKLRSL